MYKDGVSRRRVVMFSQARTRRHSAKTEARQTAIYFLR